MNLFWGRDNKPLETLDWARKLDDAEYRIVALDYDNEELVVSTIWVGIQSPPPLQDTDETALIFETAIVNRGLVEEKFRWHSEAEAFEGHDHVCMTTLGRHARPEDHYRELVIAAERGR